MTTRQEWGEYLLYAQGVKYLHALHREEQRADPPPKEAPASDDPKKTDPDCTRIVAAVGNSAGKGREYLRKK